MLFPSLLLLLLSCFRCVWLCTTPQMAAHQAPLSLGFSRQEHWSGLPFLLQCIKVKSESEVAQLRPSLSNPMDCSPSGSSVHGIFQARIPDIGYIKTFEARQYLPEKSHGQRSLVGYTVQRVTNSQTQLSYWAHNSLRNVSDHHPSLSLSESRVHIGTSWFIAYGYTF